MKAFDVIQGSEPWFDLHRGVPTASNFEKILTPRTMKPSASQHDFICELIAQRATIGSIMPKTFVSQAMQAGIDREPEARRWLEFEKNLDVQQVGFVTTDDGRFGCSPDGLIGEDSGLELKCPELKTHVKYLLDGGLPDEYRGQVHGSMIVTDRPSWWFMSYAPGLDPLLIEVQRDEYTVKLATELEAFWEKYQAAMKKLGITQEPTK